MLANRLRRHARSREHRQAAALLPDYLDGALSAQQRMLVEAHARSCANCRAVLLSPPSTIRMLRSLSAPASPDTDLIAGILARLTADAAPDLNGPHETTSGASVRSERVEATDPKSRALAAAARGAAAALRPSFLRRTIPITLLAGIVLTAMYQLGDVVHGKAGTGTYLMCACNFLVAFVLVSLGPLIALRVARRRRPRDEGPT
jgi:hypothetical protein